MMKTITRILIFLFTFHGSFYAFSADESQEINATNTCQEQDYIALRALFIFCNGDSWPYKDGWPTKWQLQSNPTMPAGTDVSTWEGVVTNEDGCVTELHFSNNNMDGVIPYTIENLTHLTHLDLTNNRFVGTIPAEIGNLTNLTYLSVGSNTLTGGIPPEIGNLTNLTVLDIHGLQMEGILPPEIGNLTNLEELILQNIGLFGIIPPEIGNLTNLRILDLWRNELVGIIPPEIGNLTNLTYLNIEYNQMLESTIPPEMGNLTNLTYFNALSTPLIGSIPPELGNLTNLEKLFLGYYYDAATGEPITPNNLTGNIPPELGNLTKMKDLILAGNLTGTIPSELGNLDSLVSLRLGYNNLTGSIPTEFADLENLEHLVLTGNQLSGCYDPALSSLCSQLTSGSYYISGKNNFDISWTNFCATQLNTCGCQHQDYITLRDLYLNNDGDNWSDNTGWLTAAEFDANPTLPTDTDLNTWYGVTTNAEGCVTELRLGNNQLSGKIPARLGNIENLTHLHLDNNQLSGAIPPEFANLQNLTSLLLSYNQLGGSIPPELENLSNLTDLHLAYNQLSGCFDHNLTRLCSVNQSDTIYLPDGKVISDGNNFDYDWAGFCYFDGIYFCTNCHEEDYTALRALYLSTNGDDWLVRRGWPTAAEFLANPTMPAGTDVSTWFGVTTSEYGYVTELYVERSNTPGTLPPEIAYLKNLKKLNLSEMELTDSIPSELVELKNLEILNLNDNNFTGNIPTELTELLNLKELRLNDNQFTNIPVEIAALINLEVLHLSDNTLVENIPPEVGSLTHLKELVLSRNELSGNIPVEIGELSNLEVLNLERNNLTGNIPSEIGNLTDLTELYLGRNELTGNIPREIGNLTKLTALHLIDNQLTGSLPAELGNLTRLGFLDFSVSRNQLSGCYDINLLSLCSCFEYTGPDTYHSYVSYDNNFRTSFYNFCNSQSGVDMPINLKVVLEGAYDPALNEMTTTLNTARGLLPGQTPANSIVVPTPAGQPYNAAPWNYTGTEGTDWTDDSYTDDAVDWVLISLRSDITKDSERARTAGILNKDGTITLPDRCNLSVNSDSVYIVIEHRNHVGVMSPQLVPITDYRLNYDFTQGNSYDGNATGAGQKELVPGLWGMYVGDADQASDTNSYDINGSDKTPWVEDNGTFDTYAPTDFNMNGDVIGADKTLWFENYGTSSRVPK